MAKRKPIVILDIPKEIDLRRLYQLAVQYREMQPWRWMDDRDTFSVIDPVSGVRYYICVLGNAGIDFSLAAFRGAAGHAFLYDMRTKDKSLSDFNDRVLLEALYLTLEDRLFLDKSDLDTLRRFGIRCEGPHNWPCFLSMGTGLVPGKLSGSECQTMIHLLEQTLLIAQRAESDKSFLLTMYVDDDDDVQQVYVPVYLTRFTTVQDGELIWQEEYREAEQFQLVYPRIRLSDKEQLGSLRAMPAQDNYQLEIDISYLNIAIRGSNGARSYYPQLMTIISSDGFILSFELLKSINDKIQSFDQQIASIFNRLLNHMGGTQSRPGQILTCRDKVYQLLEPLCDQLDIQLIRLPELKETPHMIEELMKGIGDLDDLEEQLEERVNSDG